MRATGDQNGTDRVMRENYYRDKCSFEDIKAYGEELFQHLRKLHGEGKEFAFVKEELPLYAEKYGFEFLGMYRTIYDSEEQLFVRGIN